VLICKHCESKHWIDHKLVTPINSERSVQCKTSSVEARRFITANINTSVNGCDTWSRSR